LAFKVETEEKEICYSQDSQSGMRNGDHQCTCQMYYCEAQQMIKAKGINTLLEHFSGLHLL